MCTKSFHFYVLPDGGWVGEPAVEPLDALGPEPADDGRGPEVDDDVVADVGVRGHGGSVLRRGAAPAQS